MPGSRTSGRLRAPATELAPGPVGEPGSGGVLEPAVVDGIEPARHVEHVAQRDAPPRIGVGVAAWGSQSKPSGASSDSLPWSTSMPISVAAMLLAVDQVRVRVVTSTPGA